MKKSLFLSLILLLLCITSYAQQDSTSRYYPAPELDKFIGEWKYIYPNGDVFTIKLGKKKHYHVGFNTSFDVLEGHHAWELANSNSKNELLIGPPQSSFGQRTSMDMGIAAIDSENEIVTIIFSNILTGDVYHTTLKVSSKNNEKTTLQWTLRPTPGIRVNQVPKTIYGLPKDLTLTKVNSSPSGTETIKEY